MICLQSETSVLDSSRVVWMGSVFHLPKNSGNSGWNVNGLFGSFHWKFSGTNGFPEKAIKVSVESCAGKFSKNELDTSRDLYVSVFASRASYSRALSVTN